MATVAEIRALVEDSVSALGFDLWGVQLLGQGRFTLLRIFIDSPRGITVDDCAAVSHQISALLDVEDPIKEHYTLEVSSPGLDRQLFTLGQYERYIGNQLEVRLKAPFRGRRKFLGTLLGIQDEEIVLRLGEEELVFPFEAVDRAKVICDIQF